MAKPEIECPILFENVFGTSSERVVTAAKTPTSVGCALYNEAWKTRIEGATLIVGTRITVVATLYDLVGGVPTNPLNGKAVDIYHKLDTGTPEKIKTVTIGTTSDHGVPSSGGADVYYTLAAAGKHTFYAVFAGDTLYEGCDKEVKAFAKMRSR